MLSGAFDECVVITNSGDENVLVPRITVSTKWYDLHLT